nr:hypothetical protein JVH1_6734 [Rhodococcus sp. JVH1]
MANQDISVAFAACRKIESLYGPFRTYSRSGNGVVQGTLSYHAP